MGSERDVEQYLLLGSRELFLFGDVDIDMAERAVKGLRRLVAQSKVRPVTVHLQSWGGDVYVGMSIYDAITVLPMEVTTIGWGGVGSAAALIFQAGDARLLAPSATVLIHDGGYDYEGAHGEVMPWVKYEDGPLRDRIYQVLLDKMQEADPKLTAAKLRRKCKTDVIYTAEEAVAAGLADALLA